MIVLSCQLLWMSHGTINWCLPAKLGFCQIAILVITFGLNRFLQRLHPAGANRYFETGQIGSFEKRDEAYQRDHLSKKQLPPLRGGKLIWRQSLAKSFGQIQHQLQRISFWQKVFANFAARYNLSLHQITGINVVLRFKNEMRKGLGRQVLLHRYRVFFYTGPSPNTSNYNKKLI